MLLRSGIATLLVLMCSVGSASAQSGAAARRDPAAELAALDRSWAWLEANAPDPGAGFRNRAMDALAWYAFASFHPDAALRKRAGRQLDQRLLSLGPVRDRTGIGLSYWAPMLRIRALRELPALEIESPILGTDTTERAEVAALDSTTRWWIQESLRRSGISAKPDWSTTWIATRASRPRDEVDLDLAAAYRPFHELLPATDFGRESPAFLSDLERNFVREVWPRLLAVSRENDDPDAVAEVLVTAALVGDGQRAEFARGIDWLLDRQRPDGTFISQDDRLGSSANAFRHILFVGSFALLAAANPAGVPSR